MALELDTDAGGGGGGVAYAGQAELRGVSSDGREFMLILEAVADVGPGDDDPAVQASVPPASGLPTRAILGDDAFRFGTGDFDAEAAGAGVEGGDEAFLGSMGSAPSSALGDRFAHDEDASAAIDDGAPFEANDADAFIIDQAMIAGSADQGGAFFAGAFGVGPGGAALAGSADGQSGRAFGFGLGEAGLADQGAGAAGRAFGGGLGEAAAAIVRRVAYEFGPGDAGPTSGETFTGRLGTEADGRVGAAAGSDFTSASGGAQQAIEAQAAAAQGSFFFL